MMTGISTEPQMVSGMPWPSKFCSSVVGAVTVGAAEVGAKVVGALVLGLAVLGGCVGA